MSRKNLKIHCDQKDRFYLTVCGKKPSSDIYYRVPFWCFEKLVFSLTKKEEKESLCSHCVKEFLYLHWKKGKEKKKGTIFPWVNRSDCLFPGHSFDALKYALEPGVKI